MKTNNARREFLCKTFASCALWCLAAPNLLASAKASHSAWTDQQHKFLSDAGMTMQQVYDFTFSQWYIPAMKNLMTQIGKEKFLEMLKKSSDMLHENVQNAPVNYNERTLTAFTENFKKSVEGYFKLRNTFEIIQANEQVLEAKCTECIWAKTFKEADAADIGYAGVCYQDYSSIKEYNPRIKLIREKTLMQGDDYCHFKIVMEA